MQTRLQTRGASCELFPATTSRVVVPYLSHRLAIQSYQYNCRVFSDEVPMASLQNITAIKNRTYHSEFWQIIKTLYKIK